MGRFFRAFFYYISGQFLWGAKRLERDASVVEAQFEHVIKTRRKSIATAKEAVAGVMAMHERRVADLQRYTAQVEELQETLDGAVALAQERMAALQAQGKTPEQVEQDPEYQQYLAAYQDAESSLVETEDNIKRAEADIEQLDGQVSDYVIQLQGMQREIEDLQREQRETVADMELSSMAQDVNDALSGITTGGDSAMLDSLRTRRQEAKAGAKISARLAGTDAKVQGAKLRAAAKRSRASTAFAARVGLKDAAAEETPSSEAPAAVAEKPAGKGGTL